MTPVQIRMARAALDMSAEDLASKAVVPPDEIEALERGSGGQPEAAAKLRATFETAGVEFLEEDGIRYREGGLRAAKTVPLENLSSANDE